MGNAIKNALAGMPPAHQPEIPLTPLPTHSAVEAQVAKKSKEMVQGKTEAKVKRLTAELEAARIELEQARQVLGERMGDGLDTSVAMDAMTKAESKIRMHEAGLIVWKEKGEAAQAELKKAEHQVLIEAEAAACERVLALGPRGEALFELVRQFAIDQAAAGEALRVTGGNDKYARPVSQIREQFDFFLRLASHHPRTINFPDALKMYESYTACLVAVCGMRAQP
jgi:ribosomal protein S6E (S10)